MERHVCPWWLGYFLANPLRKLVENPRKLLSPHVQEGMTVVEPGCGMGFFTLELARLVGNSGKVIAVDLQSRMLERLARRLHRAGLEERVQLRNAQSHTLGIDDLEASVDLALALYVVHEFPDQKRFFQEVRRALKPTARLLVMEPRGHVSPADFAASLDLAQESGFLVQSQSPTRRGHSALFIAGRK